MPAAKIKPGKIVINHDEWTLSDTGFQNSPDAEIFVKNVANWFSGGRPGKFHAYSSNFGVSQTKLKEAITKAGHTWTVDVNNKFDLGTLLTFDGVFVGGEAKDNKVLTDYVKAGGNVYLMGGTGVVGSAQAESNTWKAFLNAFGFELAAQYNGVSGNQAINNAHPIFAGVKSLYHNNGQSIINSATNSKDNQILVSHTSGGLFAVFDPTTGEFEVPTNSDAGVEFTNSQTKDISYKFTPSGTWKPKADIPDCTAAGLKGFPPEIQTPLNEGLKAFEQYLKYPKNTTFALLAVNKTTGAVTEVGQETTIVLKANETLTFLVNDFTPNYGDNTGILTVKFSAI
ncbi:hypothetical protein ACE1CD_27155 [Aerosakkonema sp. BLCC-F183]|uniref:hypothetical protein n=1 Tax=Aerosakkonema sp. BLCC-F183 TaxID=3342834 RepID=UPI0035B8FEF3